MASRRRALSFSRVGSFSIASPSSVVVVAAADVLVGEQPAVAAVVSAAAAIEAVLQDRVDVAVRARAGGERRARTPLRAAPAP